MKYVHCKKGVCVGYRNMLMRRQKSSWRWGLVPVRGGVGGTGVDWLVL